MWHGCIWAERASGQGCFSKRLIVVIEEHVVRAHWFPSHVSVAVIALMMKKSRPMAARVSFKHIYNHYNFIRILCPGSHLSFRFTVRSQPLTDANLIFLHVSSFFCHAERKIDQSVWYIEQRAFQCEWVNLTNQTQCHFTVCFMREMFLSVRKK